MSRISVVVPVYNVEDCLEWCLDSLRGQTLEDIEIICVNDGSTDGSRELLGKCAERDRRIRIIDQENGGLSSARNTGIRAATSDYVCFLDSDDRFHLQACETIVNILDKTCADVLTFGATCYPEEDGYPWLIETLSPRDAVYEPFDPDLLFKERSRPFAWRTACRLDFLREQDILFDDGFGEDQVFQFAVYPRSKKTVLSSKKLYDYRVVRSGSLMDKWRGDLGAKMLVHVDIVERILRDWKRGGFIGRYAPEMISFIMDFVMNDTLKLDDETYEKVASRLRDVLLPYWEERDVEQMDLVPVLHDMVKACYHPTVSSADRKKLVFRYYAFRYGRRAAVRHALLSVLNVARP